MSCRYIRRSEGGYALAFFTAHLLLYLTLRLVSLLIPEEMQLFVFMFSLFASFGLISFLHDHVTRYFGIFLLYEWSTAGFEPASSACKADVLPNELRPQNCRDRNRTDMKRHVTTPLSRSATLQNWIGTDGLEPPTSCASCRRSASWAMPLLIHNNLILNCV